ncbi:MAG: hypothetical protein MZU97_21385 [Bacillus subtilis]|nr:hypothetical protein [Bacillus subtilis]
MIERYLTTAMAAVWTDQASFNTYLEIEILNAEALVRTRHRAEGDLVAHQSQSDL